MTHRLHHLASAALAAAWTLVAANSSLAAAPLVPQPPADEVIVGRLAFVEPSAARINVLVNGDVTVREIAVAPGAEIRAGDRTITLSELVIEVGRRVTVRYRAEQGTSTATSITVEPD